MADLIDDAQAHESMFLAGAISQALAKPPDEPQERDAQGRIICAECGEVIPLARLAAVPGCARCAGCQAEAQHQR